jgi:hypothetical protein
LQKRENYDTIKLYIKIKMYENAPSLVTETEIYPDLARLAYEDLTSQESISRFEARMTQESGSFDFAAEQATAEENKDALMSQMQALMRNESLGDDQREGLFKELSDKLDNLDLRQEEAYKLKNFMEMRKSIFDTRGGMLFSSSEDEAQHLVNGIVNSAKQEESEFVPEEAFRATIDQGRPSVIIDASSKPIEVPLSSIVSAVGFQSWENGRGDGIGKDNKSSSETIKDYASRPTEIPPLDNAVALILPNGEVVIMSENSHRVAAAKLRGQKTIQIKHLTVREVETAA